MILKPILMKRNKTNQIADVEDMRYLMMRYINEANLVDSKNLIWQIRTNLLEINRRIPRNI